MKHFEFIFICSLYLSWRFDSFDQTQEYYDPGEEKGESKLPNYTARLVHAVGLAKDTVSIKLTENKRS